MACIKWFLFNWRIVWHKYYFFQKDIHSGKFKRECLMFSVHFSDILIHFHPYYTYKSVLSSWPSCRNPFANRFWNSPGKRVELNRQKFLRNFNQHHVKSAQSDSSNGILLKTPRATIYCIYSTFKYSYSIFEHLFQTFAHSFFLTSQWTSMEIGAGATDYMISQFIYRGKLQTSPRHSIVDLGLMNW